MDDVTRCIAEFAASCRFEDLPDHVVRAATERLLDTLACALGGYRSQQAQIGLRLTGGSGAGPALYAGRLLCSRDFAAADAATFANSAMIRSLDFNDTYPGGHPSDSMGALFALAPTLQADGRRFLASMVVTYETCIRLIRAGRL